MDASEIAKVIRAYKNAAQSMKNMSLEMADVILDPETDEDDQQMALDTMLDALDLIGENDGDKQY